MVELDIKTNSAMIAYFIMFSMKIIYVTDAIYHLYFTDEIG